MRARDVLRGGPLAALGSGARSLRSCVGDGAGRLSVLRRAAFGSRPARQTVDTSASPADRFRVAQDAHSRSDGYLAVVQDTKYRSTLLYLAIAIAIACLDFATFRSYSSSSLVIFGRLAPLMLALVLAHISAFGNYSIRRRRLDSLRSFTMNAREWWPVPATITPLHEVARGPAACVLVCGGVLSTLILGGNPAHAQAVDASSSGLLSALPGGDLWSHLLAYVFPGVGPLGGSPTAISNGLSAALGAFSACLMPVAAAVLALHTIIATAATAHDGELLGRRIHTFFAPLRVCFGFASLAPVVAGYSLAQIAVIWIAIASGQIGNQVWDAFVGNLGTSTISAPSLPQSMPLVRDALRLSVCYAAVHQEAVDFGNAVPPWPAAQDMGSTGTVISDAWSWATSWISSSSASTTTGNVHRLTWSYGPCGHISGDYPTGAAGALGQLATGQIAAVSGLLTALQPLAAAIVSVATPGQNGASPVALAPLFAEVVSARIAYDQSQNTAAQSFVQGASQGGGLAAFQQSSEFAGWLSAGAYYMTVARISSAEAAAAEEVPTVAVDTLSRDGDYGPLSDMLYSANNGIMPQFDEWWQSNIDSSSMATLSASAAQAGTMEQTGLWGALRSYMTPAAGLQKTLLSSATLSPATGSGLSEMASLGDYMIGAGEALVGADLVGHVAPLVLGPEARLASIASGGAGKAASGIVEAVGIALLIAGVYSAIVLPLLPFIHFTFAVLGVLLLVAEAVVAAPLLALAHIRMDGQELIGEAQRAGYRILIGLLFRIPLTVFGLILSYLVFDATVWLLSITIIPALTSATADSAFGLVDTLASLAIISVLNYSLASRCFALIHQLPDRAMRWIGSGGDGDEHGAATTTVALAGRVTQGGGGVAGRAAGAVTRSSGRASGEAGSIAPVVPSVARTAAPSEPSDGETV